MALPVLVLYLPVIQDMAVLYHLRLFLQAKWRLLLICACARNALILTVLTALVT